MERRRLETFVGVAMIALGLVQAAIYATQSEWIPTGLGLLYSGLGIAFLRVEVYADRLPDNGNPEA